MKIPTVKVHHGDGFKIIIVSAFEPKIHKLAARDDRKSAAAIYEARLAELA